MDLRQTLSPQKTGYQITIMKDLRSSVSQIVNPTSYRREQDTGMSFHASENCLLTSKPHSPLHKISGYPESQMLVEILLPSNQCHVPNLRIPRNALVFSSGYFLDMLVRWFAMIFLWISDSTTARSLPSRLHHSRAAFHSLVKKVPANTRKHESFTTNQPESHDDPVKPITNVPF